MSAVLHSVLLPLARLWRGASLSAAAAFFRRGREALLRRAEARTELEELAVQEKRQQLRQAACKRHNRHSAEGRKVQRPAVA